jgi:plastocyanin
MLVTGVVGAIPARPAGAATERVQLAGTRFTPPRLEIEMGDSVVWEAADDGHTVTARDGTFDSSPRGLMAEGDEYRFRFRLPGRYAYYCRVHQSRGMQGEIVVVDPSAPTTTTTRLTPVSAAATTSSTATTETTAAPTTTTSRPLATSSTTSLSVATATTAPPGAPAVPQEPPTLNPAARVVGSPPPDANLSESQAAARRAGSSDRRSGVALGLGAVAVLGVAVGGSVLGARGRRRRRRGRRRPPA